MNREKKFSGKQRMVPSEMRSRHYISHFLANEHAQHSANKKQKQNNCYSFVTFLCALTPPRPPTMLLVLSFSLEGNL